MFERHKHVLGSLVIALNNILDHLTTNRALSLNIYKHFNAQQLTAFLKLATPQGKQVQMCPHLYWTAFAFLIKQMQQSTERRSSASEGLDSEDSGSDRWTGTIFK
jgi:hypothetical protein